MPDKRDCKEVLFCSVPCHRRAIRQWAVCLVGLMACAAVGLVFVGCGTGEIQVSDDAGGEQDDSDLVNINQGESDADVDSPPGPPDTGPPVPDAEISDVDEPGDPDADAGDPDADEPGDPDADDPGDPDADEPGDPDAGDPDADDPGEPDTGGADCDYDNDPNCPLDCEYAEQWDSSWLNTASQVVSLINNHRSQGATCNGQSMPAVGMLPVDDSLEQAARCHSQDMADGDFVEAEGSDGSNGRERATDAGYPLGTVVTIAHGWHSTPADVVESWMEVEGLCQHVMNEDWEHIGAAVAVDDSGDLGPYWTLHFGWTF